MKVFRILFLGFFILQPFFLGADCNDEDDDDGPNDGCGSQDLGLSFIPLPLVTYDQGRSIINLASERYRRNKETDLKIHRGKKTDLYKVIEKQDICVGVGVVLNLSMAGGELAAGAAPFSFGGGAIPLIGRHVISERFTQGYSEAQHLPPLVIPQSGEEILEWTTGSSLSYQTEGGVIFLAGAQYAGLGGALMVQIKGQWGIFIQKISDQECLFSIHRLKKVSARFMVGHLLAKVGPEVMASIKRSYTFRLRLDHPVAREQFTHLVNGDLSQTQSIAADPDHPGIENYEKKKKWNKSIGVRAKIGFPIVIRRIWSKKHKASKMKINDGEKRIFERSYIDKNTYQRINNPFKKKNKRKHLRHFARIEEFSGSLTLDQEARELGGVVLWSDVKDYGKRKEFRDSIKRLETFTGLTKEIHLSLKKLKGELGFVGMMFKIPLTRANLWGLKENLSSHKKSFKSYTNQYIDIYFDKDQARLCPKNMGRKHCIKRFKEDTHGAFESLRSHLKKLFKVKERSAQGEAQIVADIAKDIGQTPFVLQLVMKTPGDLFPGIYRLNGEKFRPIQKTILLEPRP
jgi:hypothetical protein